MAFAEAVDGICRAGVDRSRWQPALGRVTRHCAASRVLEFLVWSWRAPGCILETDGTPAGGQRRRRADPAARGARDPRRPRAAARRVGIGRETAKTQLRSVFRKVNLNRQADLPRRVVRRAVH